MKAKFIKQSFFVTLAFLFSVIGFAQDYEFRVIGSKGNVLVNGKPLRVGAKLTSTQLIEVGTGAYLGLAHKSAKTLELTVPGKYKVTDLQKRLKSNSGGLAAKYARFVADELTSSDSRKTRFSQRVKTGSVSRGLHKIKFMLPAKSSYVIPDQAVTVRWYFDIDDASGLEYTVTVSEISPEAPHIFSLKTKDTFVEIDFADPKLKGVRSVNVEVLAVHNGVTEKRSYGLQKLRGSKLKAFSTEIEEFPKGETPLEKIILARYYEEKKLYGNAVHQYEAALTIADIDQYQLLYDEFLKGHRLTKETREHHSGDLKGH